MRILFYQTNIEQSGAISSKVHVIEVLTRLSGMGHTVVCPDGSFSAVRDREYSTPATTMPQPKSFWVRIKKIVNSIFGGEIAILLSFFREITLFFLASRTILSRKPQLIYRRHSIFGSENILSGIFRVPTIREVNGIVFDEMKIQNKGDKLSLKIIDVIERRNLKKADKYITVTAKLKDVLRNDYGVARNKIVVIENGANTDLFKPMDAAMTRRQLRLSEALRYICFVGVFSRWQGIENLIRALPHVLRKNPDTRALLVGDGEMKEELIEMSGQIGVSDKVIFTGAVPYEKVPLYINAAEICILPKIPLRSGYSPLKLFEYMACSRPVIATKTNGLEILEEKGAGLLVNPENSQELADAITRLLEDPALRRQMGENGRKYVVEDRSWESVAKKVAEVCEETLQEYRKKHQSG